eukprot:g13633.t1
MFRFVIAALVLLLAQSDSQEFLKVQDQVEPVATKQSDAVPEPPAAEAAPLETVRAKEIDLNAVENPYLATGATAECLALIFMIVACVICYLECCK